MTKMNFLLMTSHLKMSPKARLTLPLMFACSLLLPVASPTAQAPSQTGPPPSPPPSPSSWPPASPSMAPSLSGAQVPAQQGLPQQQPVRSAKPHSQPSASRPSQPQGQPPSQYEPPRAPASQQTQSATWSPPATIAQPQATPSRVPQPQDSQVLAQQPLQYPELSQVPQPPRSPQVPQNSAKRSQIDQPTQQPQQPEHFVANANSRYLQRSAEFPTSVRELMTEEGIKQQQPSKQLLDSKKEVIDYDNDIIDSLTFEQTLKGVSPNETEAVIKSMIAKHHTNEEVYQHLLELSRTYPDITRLYSLNQTSQEGRHIWVLEITEKPGKREALKPDFRYAANMHGDEVVGREMLLHLARLLCENYYQASSPEQQQSPLASGPKFVSKLLKTTRIHLIPTMNPDGYARAQPGCRHELVSQRGRLNAYNFDLNRNFPDSVLGNKPDSATQPEVKAMMEFSKAVPVVLGANLHGGSLVASYPYDGGLDKDKMNETRLAPDDDVFKHLALTYATNHPTMSNGKVCYDTCGQMQNFTFEQGITNGASWYSLYGGLQDWIYEKTNAFEITIEMGCNMYPPEEDLPDYWLKNKRPLIDYIVQVHRGVKGIITDQVTGQPLANVTVHVLGRSHNVTTNDLGDYYRLLMPGYYEVLYELPNYDPEKAFLAISFNMPQILNIKLKPRNDVQPTKHSDELADPSKQDGGVTGASDASPVDNSDHPIVVATLVVSILILVLLISIVVAYLYHKKRFVFGRRSMSMELQPTSRSTGTAISLPVQQQITLQKTPGSSTNIHLST